MKGAGSIGRSGAALMLCTVVAGCPLPDLDSHPLKVDQDGDGVIAVLDCDDDNPEVQASDCPVGTSCSTSTQCSTGVCSAGQCLGAACDDGVKNADETDVDCGGGCSPCGTGDRCLQHLDCAAGRCSLDGDCLEACAHPGQIGLECDECANNWAGEDCNQCAPGFTGQDCETCVDPKYIGSECSDCANPLFAAPECMSCKNPIFGGPNCDQCANQLLTGPACDQCVATGATPPLCKCPDPNHAGVACDRCLDKTKGHPECDMCADPAFVGEACDTCADDDMLLPGCTECRLSTFSVDWQGYTGPSLHDALPNGGAILGASDGIKSLFLVVGPDGQTRWSRMVGDPVRRMVAVDQNTVAWIDNSRLLREVDVTTDVETELVQVGGATGSFLDVGSGNADNIDYHQDYFACVSMWSDVRVERITRKGSIVWSKDLSGYTNSKPWCALTAAGPDAVYVIVDTFDLRNVVRLDGQGQVTWAETAYPQSPLKPNGTVEGYAALAVTFDGGVVVGSRSSGGFGGPALRWFEAANGFYDGETKWNSGSPTSLLAIAPTRAIWTSSNGDGLYSGTSDGAQDWGLYTGQDVARGVHLDAEGRIYMLRDGDLNVFRAGQINEALGKIDFGCE